MGVQRAHSKLCIFSIYFVDGREQWGDVVVVQEIIKNDDDGDDDNDACDKVDTVGDIAIREIKQKIKV